MLRSEAPRLYSTDPPPNKLPGIPQGPGQVSHQGPFADGCLLGKEVLPVKRKMDEIAITVEHGTIMFMTHDLACEDGETNFYHGVPMTFSIVIIDLVEV
ncbi:hypothetical protein THAOC_04280 [Thalassiosira oceanica]|uniref:Uncharacterized protein n=1 Tax=Thalassiosira oceanica TaxID=159749 RepID=K0TJH1_THAOC|nr:hypothetical protein THAOC_04280 [Thalassiosira oceanica]|eukprot:EJK74066.1 hypothetical protein THAOC_04280 [Thalassiosira oceanica]